MTEVGPLDDFAREILRCAQNDTLPGCHSERSEESRVTSLKFGVEQHQFHPLWCAYLRCMAHFWVITNKKARALYRCPGSLFTCA
jgi:hypothetical protein